MTYLSYKPPSVSRPTLGTPDSTNVYIYLQVCTPLQIRDPRKEVRSSHCYAINTSPKVKGTKVPQYILLWEVSFGPLV